MHICPNCQSDCDCDRGLPGCEHLCVQLGEGFELYSKWLALRDYFAAQAIPVLMQRNTTSASVATSAYKIADAMLAERDK